MAREGYRALEMKASGFLNTFTDSYDHGETRILAQEPVQNSSDARYANAVVHVEYRLLRRLSDDGSKIYLLSVTDQGTSGLCGNVNPPPEAVRDASEEELRGLKWYHFERLYDTNKSAQQGGSRGQGKNIFLHCSRVPGKKRNAMMIYDTLLGDGEYRLSDITILDDRCEVREQPMLNSEAKHAISRREYRTPDGAISVPLKLEPLRWPGTRVTAPYLSDSIWTAFRNGSLGRWLEYLWWRPIADGRLTITIIDEARDTKQTIRPPKWWRGEIYSTATTTPGAAHRLSNKCWIKTKTNISLGKGCVVKRLALYYDANLRDQPAPVDSPDYCGIQMMRAGQCIETLWDFDLIPSSEKAGFRGFVEFEDNTDAMLRKWERPAHDKFKRVNIVRDPIIPFLKDSMHDFAREIGLIKEPKTDHGKPSEAEQLTTKFVFDTLLSNSIGDIPGTQPGRSIADLADKPWDVDILLKYPNPGSERVNWGQAISSIRFVVNASPEIIRRNVRCAIEWQAPGQKYMQLGSKPRLQKGDLYGIGNLFLSQQEVEEHKAAEGTARHIVCRERGVYRIRAAVYEGKKLVAKKARRIYIEMDRPERSEEPYALSFSVENTTAPEESRIEDGDILRLQINARNRSLDDASGTLRLLLEDVVLEEGKPFMMSGRGLGEDDRRHMLHHMLVKLVRGETGETWQENGVMTIGLEPGRYALRGYLLGLREKPTTQFIDFETASAKPHGDYPFELAKSSLNTAPHWELRMEENKLFIAANSPLYLQAQQESGNSKIDEHNPFILDALINGIIEWALEPLLEDEINTERLESLRDSKSELSDDAAWDKYMDGLAGLAKWLCDGYHDSHLSPMEFSLLWRKTVAAVHQVLSNGRID